MEKYWELKRTLPNAENQKVVNEYLSSLKNGRWKKNSIIGYRYILQSFFKKIDVPFSSLNMNDVQIWLTEQKKDCNKRTRIVYLSTVRSFFSYCVEKGYIEKQSIPYSWQEGNAENYWKVKIHLPNIENQNVINEYLMSLKIVNYSKETLIVYRTFLQKFFKERQECFSSLTSNDIQQWFIQHEKGFKEQTRKNHLTSLSSFYNFCVEEGYIERSPIRKRMFPRLLKSIPKYLDKAEIAKVRRQSEKYRLRDRVLFEFLLSSGCRIGEVHRLDWTNVDLENRAAIVLGKGKKIRQVH